MQIAVSEISLAPAAVARALGVTALLLILASIGGQIARFGFGYAYVKGFVPLFNVDAERNIPNYFSLLLMVFAALLLAVSAVLARSQGAPFASKWVILSIGFLLMGYDEAFQVHELLVTPMRRILGAGPLGVLHFAWVVPGVALVLVLLLFFLRFLLHLPGPTRRRFLVAATLYLGGAIGLELVGGRHIELHEQDNWGYNAIATAEESLEMAGLISFIWALLRHVADTSAAIRFRFGNGPTTARLVA